MRRRSPLWLIFLAIGVVEVVGHFVVQARVVDDGDWRRAADRVREQWAPGDVVVSAPGWSDPLMRRELGDLLGVSGAARSDLSEYRRLWSLSIRGHRPAGAPDRSPDLNERVGRVRVLRWDLTADRVLYRMVDQIRSARVTIDGRACPPQRGRPRGGGLGAGAIEPAERFACDQRRSWLWVGATVLEDLELQPRHCIWQHPASPEVIRTTFTNIPLGERFVLAGGLYYEHERTLEHGPLSVGVFLGEVEIGRMVHRDGEGWKRLSVSTRVASRGDRERGDISVEVTAPDPNLRTFCWTGSVRGASEERP